MEEQAVAAPKQESPTQHKHPVRLVTFNVQRWVDVKSKDNVERVIETLRALNPDVVGLQEVMHPHLISSKATGILKKYRGKPAIEAVAEELGMIYVYGKEIWEDRRSGNYGNALLSKIPFLTPPTRHNAKGIAGLIIADLDLTALDPPHKKRKKKKETDAKGDGDGQKKEGKKKKKKHGKETDQGEDKVTQHQGVPRILRVGVTHLDPANEELRVQQVRAANALLNLKQPAEKEVYWKPRKGDPNYEHDAALLEQIKARERDEPQPESGPVPHLLMGDMNAMRESDYTPEQWQFLIKFSEQRKWSPPQSLAMQEIDKLGYKDTFLLVGEGEILTAWTDQTIFRLDYLLASPDFPFSLIKSKRNDSTASDHFPVWLDIEV